MRIEIRPYSTFNLKVLVYVSLIATAIGLPMVFKTPYVLVMLPFCWFLPLTTFIVSKLHEERNVKIFDDEIKCINSVRKSDSQLAVGGYLSSLTIKRSDIVSVDTYLHGNVVNPVVTTDNLRITTSDQKSYIIDGRIIDIDAVQLVLEGKIEEAEKLIKQQNKRSRTTAIVGNAILCTFVLFCGFVICSFV